MEKAFFREGRLFDSPGAKAHPGKSAYENVGANLMKYGMLRAK